MLFIEILRLIFVALGISISLAISNHVATSTLGHEVSLIIGVLLGYVLGGLFGRLISRSVGVMSRKLRDIPATEVLAAAVLATSGIVIAAVIGVPILIFVQPYIAYPAVLILAWVFAYIGIVVGATKAQQIVSSLGLARRLAPGTGPLPPSALLLDSSATMDRTFWTLARAHLLPGEVVIPRFVLDEINSLISAPDQTASRRARRALEMLDYLREDGIQIAIAEELVPEADSVEAKCLILADRLKARLITCSARIMDQASARGIRVVDLRRLTFEMLPDYQTGEWLNVDLVKAGAQPGQAVGYLPDGDMVVVNDASHLIGSREVNVEVISTKRTQQGLLVFARLVVN
ncbi:MAG: hypothetical protein QXM12_06835 [Nitrososphaerota archaeon]